MAGAFGLCVFASYFAGVLCLIPLSCFSFHVMHSSKLLLLMKLSWANSIQSAGAIRELHAGLCVSLTEYIVWLRKLSLIENLKSVKVVCSTSHLTDHVLFVSIQPYRVSTSSILTGDTDRRYWQTILKDDTDRSYWRMILTDDVNDDTGCWCWVQPWWLKTWREWLLICKFSSLLLLLPFNTHSHYIPNDHLQGSQLDFLIGDDLPREPMSFLGRTQTG